MAGTAVYRQYTLNNAEWFFDVADGANTKWRNIKY